MSSPIRAVPNIVGADLRIEGDNVTIKNLTIADGELAKYLSTKEGAEQVLLLIELIETAMQIQRMANTSADVKELNAVAKQVRETMKTAGDEAFTGLQKLIQDQGEDNKPGNLINLLKTKLVDQVIAELDPNKETSPFHSISEQLVALLEKSAGEKATQESYANSREKGIDFEELLDQMIQLEAVVHGDDAQFTGDFASPSGDKTGDEVVTINPAVTNNEEIRIVWEAKTDKSFKSRATGRVVDDQVKKELNAVIADRSADAPILVLDSEGIDMEAQTPWREYDGNKLLIIVDLYAPETDLIRLAYLWGRWKSRSSIGNLETQIDFDGIRGSFDAMQLRLKDLRNVKKSHNDAIKSIESAGGLLKSFRDDIKDMMEELARMVNVKLEIDTEKDELD